MLTFKFFVFIGIVVALVDSIKKIKQKQTTKNKVSVVVTALLLLFGIYMMADSFL